MTSSLKAKFLQHLASKKRNGGFTLIELLVVIIIIGILAAIALPSFLNQANKAKQSEAKTYVGSMNRAQQAYFLENNEFVILDTNIPQLGLGIRAKTENYEYKVTGDNAKPAKSYSYANVVKTNAPLKAYIGGVVVGEVGDADFQALDIFHGFDFFSKPTAHLRASVARQHITNALWLEPVVKNLLAAAF